MATTHHLALVRDTTKVDAADLTRTAAAIQNQVANDFAPIWKRPATVDAFLKLEDVPVNYWPMIVRDDIPYDAQGIHLDNQWGPYSLILWDAGWSLTASHECLEMLADPYGKRTRRAPSPKAGQGDASFLVEVCDPCEADQFAYQRNAITVSDFYLPTYLTGSGTGKYSFTGALTKPRQVLKGGYLSWKDVATGIWWQQTYFGTQPKFVTLGAKPRDASPRVFTDGLTKVPRKVMRPSAAAARQATAAFGSSSSSDKAKAMRANVRELLGDR